jgi:hypothetical protein
MGLGTPRTTFCLAGGCVLVYVVLWYDCTDSPLRLHPGRKAPASVFDKLWLPSLASKSEGIKYRHRYSTKVRKCIHCTTTSTYQTSITSRFDLLPSGPYLPSRNGRTHGEYSFSGSSICQRLERSAVCLEPRTHNEWVISQELLSHSFI